MEKRDSHPWMLPKELREQKPRVDVDVNMSGFADRFDQLVAEHPDQNYGAVLTKALHIGYWLFFAKDNEEYALRESTGLFEEPIGFMDDRFFYNKDAVLPGEDEQQKRTQKVWYGGKDREKCMTRANELHIDLEEAAARQILIGIHVLEQIRDNHASLVHKKEGVRSFIETSYPQPKYEVKEKLWKYYADEVAKRDNGAEGHSNSRDRFNEKNLLEGPRNEQET